MNKILITVDSQKNSLQIRFTGSEPLEVIWRGDTYIETMDQHYVLKDGDTFNLLFHAKEEIVHE